MSVGSRRLPYGVELRLATDPISGGLVCFSGIV